MHCTGRKSPMETKLVSSVHDCSVAVTLDELEEMAAFWQWGKSPQLMHFLSCKVHTAQTKIVLRWKNFYPNSRRSENCQLNTTGLLFLLFQTTHSLVIGHYITGMLYSDYLMMGFPLPKTGIYLGLFSTALLMVAPILAEIISHCLKYRINDFTASVNTMTPLVNLAFGKFL